MIYDFVLLLNWAKGYYTKYFWNDFGCLANQNPVADIYAELVNDVLIVQSCPLDGGSSQIYRRVKYSNRRHPPGSAGLQNNVFDCGFLFFRRIFVGDCPARVFCGLPQLSTQAQIVHLDNGAVDPVFEPIAIIANLKDGVNDVVLGAGDAPYEGEPEHCQQFIIF